MSFDQTVRLAGSCTLAFSVSASVAKAPADFLAKLGENVPAVVPHVVQGRTVTKWDSKTGEPASTEHTTVHRVLAALSGKSPKLLAADKAQVMELLTNLQALSTPKGSPWKCPLIRVVVPCPTRLQGGAQRTLTLTFHVYFGRLLFEMIADPAIAAVMKHITPCSCVEPVVPLQTYPQTLFSAPPPVDEDEYSAAALLRGMEHTGYREAAQPAGVTLPMFGFQRQALGWMQDQEGRPGGLNAAFWETRRWGDADSKEEFYYMPLGGELRLVKPPHVTGGMLCLQMGLGKTLCMSALMVADKRAAAAASGHAGAPPAVRSRATLVVVPTSLLSQWRREIAKSTLPGTLRVAVYPPQGEEEEEEEGEGADATETGFVRTSVRAAAVTVEEALEEALEEAAKLAARGGTAFLTLLADNDVVLTTYHTLNDEAKPLRPKVLCKIHWRRIVLDECQEVRSNTTSLARTAAALKADHRWMVSGTPMHTGVNDLNGELMFLGVWPFSLSNSVDGFWERNVAGTFAAKDPYALRMLRALLSGVALRHSKTQTDASGAPLALLPPATAELRPVHLSGSDAYVIAFLENYAARVLGLASDMGFLPACPDVLASNAAGANAARRRALQVAQSLLRLLRESCTVVGMPRITPAPGATAVQVAAAARADKTQWVALLKQVDGLIRAAMGGVVDAAAPGGTRTTGSGILSVASLPADAALQQLMRRHTTAGSALDVQAGLVRHGDAASGANYDTGRTYAQEPLSKKLADALSALAAVQRSCLELARSRALLRWQLLRVALPSAALQKLAEEPQPGDEKPKKPLDAFPLTPPIAFPISHRISLLKLKPSKSSTSKKQTALYEAVKALVQRSELVEEALAAPTKRGTAAPTGKLAELAAGCGFSVVQLRAMPRAQAVRALLSDQQSAHDVALHELLKQKKKKLEGLSVHKVAADEDAAAKTAYVGLLRRAVGAVGEDAQLPEIAQTGFQGLNDLAEGRAAPVCPVCYSVAIDPCVTPCVHISCTECTLTWLAASSGLGKGASCILCRKTYARSELIRVIPGAAAGPSAPPAPVIPGPAAPPHDGIPRFTPAASDADLAAAAAAAANVVMLRGDGKFPSIPPLFLSHAFAARAGRSAKEAALLHDVLTLLASDVSAKAVVFSQSSSAVTHVSLLLRDAGVGCVQIQVSMPEAERRDAIELFNTDPAVRVFVLHVGAAAAGLTLTAANTMYLLEPFLNESDEAQATNRCHRIGQARACKSVTYYTVGTVEERLLAYRQHERMAAPAPTSEGAGPSADEARAASRRKAKGKAARRHPDDEGSDEEMEEAARCGALRAGNDGLAMLGGNNPSVDNGNKLRFLFGLAPADQ